MQRPLMSTGPALFIGVGVLAGIVIAATTVLPSLKALNAGLDCMPDGCDADLLAQRSMALATWVMVGLTAITGALSIALIFWTLLAALRSATAAERAVEVTIENGQRQIRAYLTVNQVYLKTDGDAPSLHFVVYNSGQSPARYARAMIDFHWTTINGRSVSITQQLMGEDIPSQSARTLGHVSFPAVDLKEEAFRMSFLGKVQFLDVFGKKDSITVHGHLPMAARRPGTHLVDISPRNADGFPGLSASDEIHPNYS